jgi:hypothetical protein
MSFHKGPPFKIFLKHLLRYILDENGCISSMNDELSYMKYHIVVIIFTTIIHVL